jgi:hypothetical protein
MTALAVAVGLLAVLTLLNLFILLGVIRRLRTMAAADVLPEVLPAPGTPVGPFAVTATDGTAVTDADVATGESLVLLLSLSCAPCQKTADKLVEGATALPARTIILLRREFEEEDPENMIERLSPVGTVVTFGGEEGVEGAFGSRGYPTALRINDGVIVSASNEYAEVLPQTAAVPA